MNRQRLILFILLIVFAIAAIWSYSAVPRPKTVARLKYTQGQQAVPSPKSREASQKEKHDGRGLNIALLEQGQPDFRGYRRNVFKPIFVDEQKILHQKSAAVKPHPLPPVQSQKAAPAAPSEPVVTHPESAPLARFTFLGFLKKDGKRTIFLAKDKDIILVKKGDKFAGRYEAAEITEQALTLHVTDTGDEIVIPLIENRPLSSAR